MLIGDHIRAIREAKKLSQGDIEKRSGLKRAYISRVEHGHNVPSVETLEKLARALEIPLYRLFYEGEKPPKLPKLPKRVTAEEIVWGRSKKEAPSPEPNSPVWRYCSKGRRLNMSAAYRVS